MSEVLAANSPFWSGPEKPAPAVAVAAGELVAADPPKPPVDIKVQWAMFALGVAGLLAWVYLSINGKTTDPPPTLPPLPSVQSAPAIPPGHTATIQTDTAGKVSMFVCPNP